jgi:hypothetical protein
MEFDIRIKKYLLPVGLYLLVQERNIKSDVMCKIAKNSFGKYIYSVNFNVFVLWLC